MPIHGRSQPMLWNEFPMQIWTFFSQGWDYDTPSFFSNFHHGVFLLGVSVDVSTIHKAVEAVHSLHPWTWWTVLYSNMCLPIYFWSLT